MNKFRHFYIDIYGINLYFIKCKKDYFVKKFRAEFKTDVCASGCASFCFVEKRKQDVGVIWIESYEQLHHEVFHAVAWIMRDIGMAMTEPSEEAYAYLMDYIVRLIRKRK